MENNFAPNLLALRRNKGLNQTEIAEIIGKKKSIIGPYEKGTVEPDISSLIRLSKYFGISVSDLIGKDLSKSVHVKRAKEIQAIVQGNVQPMVEEENKQY